MQMFFNLCALPSDQGSLVGWCGSGCGHVGSFVGLGNFEMGPCPVSLGETLRHYVSREVFFSLIKGEVSFLEGNCTGVTRNNKCIHHSRPQ